MLWEKGERRRDKGNLAKPSFPPKIPSPFSLPKKKGARQTALLLFLNFRVNYEFETRLTTALNVSG